MNTNNNFETMSQANNTETAEQIQIQPNKVDIFMKKAGAFFDAFEKKCTTAFDFLCRAIPRELRKLSRFSHYCFDMAVKLSIIVIAMMMFYDFIEAHPAEWANCVSMFVDAFETVKNWALDTYNQFMDTFFWFM